MPTPTAPLSEQFILAWILTDPSSVHEVVTKVPNPDVFHTARYRKLYQHILEITARGLTPDMAAITREQTLEQVGIMGEIITTLPDPLYLQVVVIRNDDQLDTHVRLLMDAFVKRETALAFERGEAADQVMDRLSMLTRTGSHRIFNGAELADLVYAVLTDKPDLIPFAYRELNRASAGGMRKGEMIIIGARQGVGKSAFLQNQAMHTVETGKRVLFVSAEMGSDALAGRWATIKSKQQILRFDGIADMQAATRAAGEMSEWGDRLITAEMTSVAAIESQLKSSPFDLVCVDYLQKMTSINPKPRSEYERVSEISRTLDNMCQKYQVPMMVAAQFNRRAEGIQPSIADLRDSGQIEADADMVISIWQKNQDKDIGGREKLYFDILKNRNGFTLHNSPDVPDSKEFSLWFDKPNFTIFDTAYAYLEGE